jgi:lipopolysaccharide/colanic/teichoic acid biosynthesis glycosyltransferase
VALILVSPILLIVAILIRLDSSGPALYRQPRVGLRGRLFTIYKFRSMKVSKPGEPMRLTSHNDDRVTRVGRFIRLHRIDELPQFFNVLLGDMSLVGPRPEVESSVKELRVSLPFYDQRHAIRPGITSLGQVRFGAATTLSEARERLKYDLYYQKNMSLAFDLSILIDTVKVVLLKILVVRTDSCCHSFARLRRFLATQSELAGCSAAARRLCFRSSRHCSESESG